MIMKEEKMKRSLSIVIAIISLTSGCILSKTPNTNNVTMGLGEQKTLSVNVFPSSATYSWTLDETPISNTTNSYTYTALAGTHTLTVKAKQSYGTDTQTWIIYVGAFNKTFKRFKNDYAEAVVQTSDGGYILAGFTLNLYGTGEQVAWLIKTDANGNKIWKKTFGGSQYERAMAVKQTGDGGYILAVDIESYGASLSDTWLIKTDAYGETCDYSANGNCHENASRWAKTFGESGIDHASAVAQTSDGGYILAGGNRLIKIDGDGNELWNTAFGDGSDYAHDARQTSDGGYILAGFRIIDSSNEYYDVLLTKTDEYGNKLWDKTFGGGGENVALAVEQTNDDGYILAGTTAYGAGWGDAWLIKTDAYGDTCYYSANGSCYENSTRWIKTFGGSYVDCAWDVAQTSDGGYILAGIADADYFNASAFLIKTDADGNAPATPTP
jgi:hypothetical protein